MEWKCQDIWDTRDTQKFAVPILALVAEPIAAFGANAGELRMTGTSTGTDGRSMDESFRLMRCRIDWERADVADSGWQSAGLAKQMRITQGRSVTVDNANGQCNITRAIYIVTRTMTEVNRRDMSDF